jgi:hypothetical protein
VQADARLRERRGTGMGTVVTVLTTVVAIVITALVTRWYSSRRALDIVLSSAVNVLQLPDVGAGRVTASYDGEPVRSLWSLTILVCNTGNVDIDSKQVRKAPAVALGGAVRVLDATVLTPERDDRRVAVSSEPDGNVQFAIGYLRRGCGVECQLLLDQDGDADFSPDGLSLADCLVENADCRWLNLLGPRAAWTYWPWMLLVLVVGWFSCWWPGFAFNSILPAHLPDWLGIPAVLLVWVVPMGAIGFACAYSLAAFGTGRRYSRYLR